MIPARKLLLLVLIIVGVGSTSGFLYTLVLPTAADQSPQRKNERPGETPSVAYVPGLPMRIVIPSINVTASIDSLGLTPEGDLAAPEDIRNAGWYNAGPRAGSPGTAVIDGHYGGTVGKPAVFDRLHTLQKGDQVHIEDSDKKTHVYVVRETRTFLPDEDATEVFRSVDGKSNLNLITCQGIWNSSKETYSKRLVVFTDLQYE